VEEWAEANRANWDERVAIHAASRFYDVEGWLAGDRMPRQWELDVIGDVAGLDVVHLQCHFGMDTLMLAQAGARVTGVDISPAAVKQAIELAERAGLAERSRFVEANVYDAAAALAPETFDLVYVSLGALCWLPRVGDWAAQVGALLRPGGRLFLHDGHPLSHALSYHEPLALEWSYFEETEPWVEESEGTYTDGDVKLANTRTFEWNHSLGEIVTALLAQDLQLTHLEEHDWTVFHRHPSLQEQPDGRWTLAPGSVRIPLSYTLMATKRAAPGTQ
jgi:SAM-dependent methyltransferase